MSCSTVVDRILVLAAFAGLLAAGSCGAGNTNPLAELSAEEAQIFAALLATEDARPVDAAGRQPLNDALQSDNPTLRRLAARAYGRLEQADVSALQQALEDDDPTVRAEAANAVAQSVYGETSGNARDLLVARLDEESEPRVIGAIGQALGRIQPASPLVMATTERTLVELSRDAPLEQLLPVARGLESLARANARNIALSDATVERWVELTHYGRLGTEGHVQPGGDEPVDSQMLTAQARIRRLALAALTAASRIDPEVVESALLDRDDEVRRLAAIAAGRLQEEASVSLLLEAGLADTAAPVRFEALGGYGRRLQAELGCGSLLDALGDADAHVALLAIDLLGNGCESASSERLPEESNQAVAARLTAIAESLPGQPGPDPARDGIPPPVSAAVSAAAPTVDWHRPAHALLALANLDPAAAARLIPAFSGHPTWQVRMYAARAAGTTGSSDSLEALSADPQPNVVSEALGSLGATLGRLADGSAVRALGSDDYQTLISAARLLQGSESPDVLPALIEALGRITEQKRETSRDPRRILIERIGELGSATDADVLAPYLRDFDPAIAAQAAEVLSSWTGEPHAAVAQPLEPLPLPSLDELLALQSAHVSIVMDDGGVIELRLLPFEAPTNVARFARQARSGYFEGLTFHRVAANFVIQGGSPGANEYMGDGPFTRDELTTRSHLRGTVGISTRGRDTDDSQIFVNLVDNVRLDHNYTIIAEVVSGMDVVDRVLEGARIARLEIVEPDVVGKPLQRRGGDLSTVLGRWRLVSQQVEDARAPYPRAKDVRGRDYMNCGRGSFLRLLGKILEGRDFLYQAPRCTKRAMSCGARYGSLIVAVGVLFERG